MPLTGNSWQFTCLLDISSTSWKADNLLYLLTTSPSHTLLPQPQTTVPQDKPAICHTYQNSPVIYGTLKENGTWWRTRCLGQRSGPLPFGMCRQWTLAPLPKLRTLLPCWSWILPVWSSRRSLSKDTRDGATRHMVSSAHWCLFHSGSKYLPPYTV